LKFIEAPAPELYDLKADAHELQNTYAPWDARVQKLRRTLTESFPQKQSAEKAATPASTVDELHALGYLGAADVGSSTDVPEPSLLPDPKDKIEEQNLLHIAMMSSEDGRIADARTALEKLLSIDGVSVTALRLIGELELTAGNLAEASNYLQRAYVLRPQDSSIALAYSEALERSHDLTHAREVLEANLKSHPDQFSIRLRLGRLYLHSNDAKSAAAQLEAAQLMQPENVEVSIDLAKALIGEGNFADAVEILHDANAPAKNTEASKLLAASCSKLDQRAESTGAAARAKSICKSRTPH
jgi:predicted Zn-dependent protease